MCMHIQNVYIILTSIFLVDYVNSFGFTWGLEYNLAIILICLVSFIACVSISDILLRMLRCLFDSVLTIQSASEEGMEYNIVCLSK